MKNALITAASFLVAIESLVAATEPAVPGITFPPLVVREELGNTEIPADRQGSISVVAARWGAYGGWVDVTERVRVFVRDGQLVIPHVPDSLGQLRDPAFGYHKALVVVYQQGQETRLVIVPSQGRLELPEPAPAAPGRRPDVNVVQDSDMQAATSLVGITRNQRGQIGLVNVDLATGKATAVLKVPVGKFECYSLAYHGPSGRFLTADVRSTAIGIFDPALETFTKVAIVGLPAGQEKISGITYQPNKDRILVSFGPSGGNHENRIAQINLEGHVLKISADMGLGDRDFLGWHPLSGNLLAIDFNGRSPRIAAVVDPFGTLSTMRFSDPPRDSQLTDLAVLSPHGRMFTVRQDSGELVEVIDGGKRFSTIGSFQTRADVVGIAATPNDWRARQRGRRPQESPLKPAAKSLKRPVFESVLGVYGEAIRGQRYPFVNLRPPDRNLWTREIENRLRGTLSYAQVDYIGTAKLVIPASGTYTIDLPARGTELRLNGIVLKAGEIALLKGVYDVEIYTHHWGQPYLKYAHVNVFKQGTRTKIPFVNTAVAIEDFRSQTIDSRRVIEVCNYPVKRVRVVGGATGSMLRVPQESFWPGYVERMMADRRVLH